MRLLDNFLSKHKERIVGLDILRCIAILIVIYDHGKFLMPKEYYKIYSDLAILKIDGVSIFFVLSGFLIGGILLKIIKKTNFTTKDLLNFWIRRWFRTIPNYLIVLIGLLSYRVIVFGDLGEFNYKYLLFLQNFSSPHPGFFPEVWSLTIEEWFYLLFPLACYLFYKIFKNKSKSVLISAIIFLIFPLVFRIVKFELGIGVQEFDLEFRKIVLLRLDSIMYGVLAAYILFKFPEEWFKYRVTFLSLGCFLLIMLYFNPFNYMNFYPPLFFNIESITTVCFIPYMSKLKSTRIKFIDTFCIFISVISYSMYLLNYSPVQGHLLPVINSLTGRDNLPIEEVFVLNYMIYLVATVVGAYVLYTVYENPMTRLRDRIKVK